MQKVLKELFDQFVKTNGREPDNLEMILIRQKASAEDIRKIKIVSMFDRSPVDANKPILGGQNIQETDAQILERLNKGNEEGINRLKNKKDEPDNMATGGRAGYYGGGAAMVGEDLSEIGHGSDSLMARNMQLAPNSMATTSTGLNYLLGEDNDTVRVPYNEGNMVLPKPKPDADPMVELLRVYNLYQESMPGVSQDTKKYLQQDFIQKLNDAGISQEQFMTNRMQNNLAEGGPARQNFKMGKRAFLKLIGSGVAGIASLKTGLLDFTKGGGKKVAKEVVKEATGAPPAYFFKLVDKIRKLGDESTAKYATNDREVVTNYKDYTLTEDITTGEKTIQRFKDSEVDYYDEILMEETYMSYRPGKSQMDETTKGKTLPDEYTEDTSYLRTSGPQKGDILETVSGVSDDIFQEVGEVAPEAIRKEKADGGRIGYAGGKKVAEEILKKANKKLGKKAVTTADKADIPKETLLRDMFTDTNKRLNKKREMTVDEYEDFVEEVGGADQLEAYNFDGTVGDAERILKEQEDRMKYMYEQYRMGKLDPVAGDKSPARKRFLEKKMEESLMSGDSKLMTREEIDELYNFDLGVEMQTLKDGKTKSIIPKDEYKSYKNDFDKEILDEDIDISQGMIDLDEMNFTKNAQAAKNKMDNMDVNQKIKEGVASIMSDTSPAALQKSIEIDNLMLKYPGMDNALAEQIATSEPIKKADLIAMVEQTFKLSEQGKSGSEIIDIFKKTPRTKQATGGLASILR